MTRFPSLHILWASLFARIGGLLDTLLPQATARHAFAPLQPLPVTVSQHNGRRIAAKGRVYR